MAKIEYDNSDVKDVVLSKCQKYHGRIPPSGLYFTEGDLVTIHSKLGRQYDAEGVVIAIEKVENQKYQSPKNQKWMEGKFGIFTVGITNGDNIGHQCKGIRSEELRRRGKHANVQTVFPSLLSNISLPSGLSESDIIARVNEAGNKIKRNYEGGAVYHGQMKGGKEHGYGTYNHPDGPKYVGQYKNGKRNGVGIYTRADGKIYHSGEWENGQPVGAAKRERQKKKWVHDNVI